MRRWGVQKKVFFLSLIPTMVLIVIVGVYFTHSWVSNLSRMLEERGMSLSRQLASASEYGAFTGNRNLLFGIASSMLEEDDVRAITIYDSDGRKLVQTGRRERLQGREPLQNVTSPTVHTGEDASLFTAPIYPQDLMIDGLLDMDRRRNDDSGGEQPLGWASVELSHATTRKEQYEALLVSLLLVGGGLFLNTLIAIHLSRSVTDPIHELTRAINRLREGNLDTRVEMTAGPELEELASGLNAMAGSLQQARDEMQQNVDQATEDLRETLETIEVQNIELDLARKQALEASRIKSEFLANMSHEIRTPLNGIIGFTDLLLKAPASAQQRDHLNTIRKSSEILLTIINDILDFSKIEAGKLVLDRTPFHLRETVEEVLIMLAPAAHEKNLDLAPLIYTDVPDAFMGDPLRIKQVLTNLVNNAIKFTQHGEVVVRVMLDENDPEDERIRISVTDTGVGLSDSQQESIFNAFNQADASTARQYGGTGLGLVISRRLVEEMGGEIGVDSELGRGSSFWFSLPLETSGAAETASEIPLSGELVLYLEYQETSGLAITNLLRESGVDVTHAHDPQEVITQVQSAQASGQGFALVILGVARHLLHSNQHRELIRTLEYECDCRVLLLTPTLNEDTGPLVTMASAHMTKPVRRTFFQPRLRQLIQGTDDSSEQPRAPALLPTAHQETNARVLAVDDNEANLKLVTTLLREFNLHVEDVSSGYEALQRLQQETFDLVLMDVQMPGMDGTDATTRIRQLSNANSHVPVIALTAHALSEEREHLLASGFDGYLTKPINPSLIAQTLQRHLGLKVQPPQEREAHPHEPEAIRPSSRGRQHPVVDPNACLRLANGKPDLAEEMLSMLLDHVEEDRNAVETLHNQGDRATLLERVHRLHGATHYTGVPELGDCAADLETRLKQDAEGIEPALERLLAAMDRLLRWCEQTHWHQLLHSADT
ncbi:ATP-binding protein [Vreelandella utahensis]|uniref:ATP-binding protein n=1 Tax=Vreelandella halophila TaxID=86177 RepID=UPI000986FA72|nr:ATP-binding protein [Halomonas utahensis]